MRIGLDHILLGVRDLDRGIAWVEQRTGVRAAFGGVHPGRGTRNALLSLGPECYLEIIAPDPQQSQVTWFPKLWNLSEPQLIAWSAHTSDLATLARNAVAAGFAIDGPHDGARSLPDGTVLCWKLFHLRNDRDGLLPFFIEWARDAIHPAVTAPPGCVLERFSLQAPDAPELTRAINALGLKVAVDQSERPSLLARIVGPGGSVEMTS
jgi:hypothetical protein